MGRRRTLSQVPWPPRPEHLKYLLDSSQDPAVYRWNTDEHVIERSVELFGSLENAARFVRRFVAVDHRARGRPERWRALLARLEDLA